MKFFNMDKNAGLDIINLAVYGILILVVYSILLFTLFSCDILRNGVFEVVAWNPGGGYHDPVKINVMLAFSLEPDRNSVERSFSLSENGQNLSGHFSWQGNRMIFSPASPLAANKEYLIVLKTDAQDTRGLNIEKQFEAAFTTRNGNGRPTLLLTNPADGGIMPDERGRVELMFSSPMNRSSLQHLVFSPSVSGVWALEQDNYLAVFTPSENWYNGRSYRLTIGAAIADEKEMEMGRDLFLHFSAGTDTTRPELLTALILDKNNNTVGILAADDGSVLENAGWEKDYKIGLKFSKPVDSMSVASALNCDPSLGIALEMPPGFYDYIIGCFSGIPVYDSSYAVTLGKAVKDRYGNTMDNKITWHIRTDGPKSKPPVLIGLRMPKDPVSLTEYLIYGIDDLFADFPIEGGYYTFDYGINTFIELYFDTAAGAGIELLSLMDRFKFNATNGCLSFSPHSVEVAGFSVTDPAPLWADCCRVEIRGVMTNHPYTGMVTIELGAGLQDSHGNKSTEAQRFLLLK